MLDTVILQIPIDYSAIIDPDQFSPSAKILENLQGFFRCVNNPTKANKEKWGYIPRLTVIKRREKNYLKVEFSAPKLLFGNNLDELEETNFDEVVSKLQKIIKEMGVILWSHQIEKAEVIAFHPSKNIPLSKGYTSLFVIRELSKINLNQKLDLERVGFRNDGEALQFYANRHSLVLYDKINDLNKPAKRAIDKDQTKQQVSLFDYIKKEKRQLEVLRFEIRLSHRVKVKEVLEKIGYSDNPLFRDIFKKEICQKILKLYWNEFFSDNRFLFSTYNNPQKILELIFRTKPKTRAHTAVLLVGLHALCKDEEGFRGFKNIIYAHKPKTNFLSLKQFIRNFENDIFKYPQHGFIKDIEKALTEFEPFKLGKSYPLAL